MRTVVAHGHIFKNAGSTFDWALKKNYDNDFCDHRDDQPMRQIGARYLERFLLENPSIKAFSSHHLCDTSDILPIKIIPVYFLRHPIERAFSVYNFEKKQDTQTPGAIAAKRYDFKDYIKWRMEPDVGRTIRNYQTVYLAGMLKLSPTVDVDITIFNKAILKLNNTKCIGLVENYSTSLTLIEIELKKHIKNLDLSYIPQNIGNKADAHVESKVAFISECLGDAFNQLLLNNAFDLALYQHAKMTIKSRLEKIKNIEEKIHDFEFRCKKLLK